MLHLLSCVTVTLTIYLYRDLAPAIGDESLDAEPVYETWQALLRCAGLFSDSDADDDAQADENSITNDIPTAAHGEYGPTDNDEDLSPAGPSDEDDDNTDTDTEPDVFIPGPVASSSASRRAGPSSGESGRQSLLPQSDDGDNGRSTLHEDPTAHVGDAADQGPFALRHPVIDGQSPHLNVTF